MDPEMDEEEHFSVAIPMVPMEVVHRQIDLLYRANTADSMVLLKPQPARRIASSWPHITHTWIGNGMPPPEEMDLCGWRKWLWDAWWWSRAELEHVCQVWPPLIDQLLPALSSSNIILPDGRLGKSAAEYLGLAGVMSLVGNLPRGLMGRDDGLDGQK